MTSKDPAPTAYGTDDNSTSKLGGSWCGAEGFVQQSETPEPEKDTSNTATGQRCLEHITLQANFSRVKNC